MNLILVLKYASIFSILSLSAIAQTPKLTAQEDGTGALLLVEQQLKEEWARNEHDTGLRDNLHRAANEVRSALCKKGKEDYCPVPEVDMDALAIAVAQRESGGGTSYSARVRNNWHGIMYWPNGVRTQVTYASKEDSFKAFKKLWVEKYGMTFPTYAMAKRYTGNDGPDEWLKVVTDKYNKVCKRAKVCPASSQ